MNTDQYQRPAAERLHAATMGGLNLQRKPPGWTPPNPNGIPNHQRPLDHLDEIQYEVLFNGLLEDWENPVYTELGLCRAHGISLDQLIAIAERPHFQKCLDNIHKVRAMRRPRLEAAAANTILERLLYITQCTLDSASAMKECRLAIKQIHAILNPEAKPATKRTTKPATQIAPNASEGMVPEDSANATEPTTPTPSTNPPSTSRARKEAPAPASQSHAPEEPPHPQSTPVQSTSNASEEMVPQNTTNTSEPTPLQHSTHATEDTITIPTPTSEKERAGDTSPAPPNP
jgi:hypothetical protein